MTQQRLKNEEFLEKLAGLLKSQSSTSHGSIHLTQKRLSHNTADSLDIEPRGTKLSNQFSDTHLSTPLPLLIRATNGKSENKGKDKIKLATVVEPDDIEAFFARYSEVCRAGMTGLKKRDRSKGKKKKKTGTATAANPS